LGTLLLLGALRMWRKPLAAVPASPMDEVKPVQQDEYMARFEEELKKRK
jgi:hypothetical protein